jgi:hypothetical protein
MKRLLLAGVALAAMGAGSAFAGTLYYDHYGWIGDAVQIETPTTIYGGAGQIQLYDAHNNLLADAWCLDVSSYLQQPQLMGVVGAVPAVQEPGFPAGGLSSGQLGVIEHLVHDGDNVMAHGGTADQSAAYQLAIWTEEYGGGFTYDDIGLGGLVSADLLTASIDPPFAAGQKFDFLVPIRPEPSQTLITESFAAPEPGTWAMLLMGFGLMGAAGWRKARGGVGAVAAAL